MSPIQDTQYIVKSVEPDLPAPTDYMYLLEQIHKSNFYTNFGPLCQKFAGRLVAEFGIEGEGCVPCASATTGLSAALIASGSKGPVLIPGFTFPATLSAVRGAGLEPLVMDVCPTRWMIDVGRLSTALNRCDADAVILVAPFGMQADFAEQIDLCLRRGVRVIIDCAAGMGVQRINFCRRENVFEVYSLHATKPFGVGEGGLIFCSGSQEATVIAALNFALPSFSRADGPGWGINGKISEFHVAIGLCQLDRYREMVLQRQLFVREYLEALREFSEISVPADPRVAPWQVLPILLPSERAVDAFVTIAAMEGIEIRRYYRPSLSQWRHARRLEDCAVSEDLAARMVALPVRRATHVESAHPIINGVGKALRRAMSLEV